MIVCCTKCDSEEKGFTKHFISKINSAKAKLALLTNKIPKYQKDEWIWN